MALDWTPNTNHVGFYVAQALGFYHEAGLSVTLLSPHLDNYALSPASRLTSRAATFALCPSETVISYHLPPVDVHRSKLTAVATVLQQDLSAVVTLKDSGIQRPQGLDGRIYASYGARFEGRIIQKLIQSDGGRGQYIEMTPEKLGIWDTLVAGKADSTWVFKGWECVEARLRHIELNEFCLGDFGIPYGYSPVVACLPDTIINKPQMVRKFLGCTGKGFAYAAANTEHASKILVDMASREDPALPKPLELKLVSASTEYMSKYFLNNLGNWGVMDPNTWRRFLDWLSAENLLTTLIQSRKPVSGVSASLDDLRSGNAGNTLEASDLNLEEMFTNAYL